MAENCSNWLEKASLAPKSLQGHKKATVGLNWPPKAQIVSRKAQIGVIAQKLVSAFQKGSKMGFRKPKLVPTILGTNWLQNISNQLGPFASICAFGAGWSRGPLDLLVPLGKFGSGGLLNQLVFCWSQFRLFGAFWNYFGPWRQFVFFCAFVQNLSTKHTNLLQKAPKGPNWPQAPENPNCSGRPEKV